MRKLLALLVLQLSVSGCVSAMIGAGTETGVALAEERSLGAKVDDSVIYADISNRFAQYGKDGMYIKVTIRVRHQRVMLTGIVPTQAMSERATALAWQARGVKEVINDIIISSDDTALNTANDIIIKKNLESRLLVTKHVWLINYSIDVVNGTVYLLGKTADRAELDRVMNVTRSTKGVKKVVSHLLVKSETQTAPASASPSGVAPTESGGMVDTSPYSSSIGYTSPTAPTDGTISTDSVSASELPPAGGY